MRIRLLSLSAMLLQVALGNVCMMPMAYAEMPMHSAGMDMMHGTDYADCEHCAEESPASQEPSKTMDCGSGHCFMHASTDGSVRQQGSGPTAAILLPASFPVSFAAGATVLPLHSTAPPGAMIHTKTIVLRY